MLVIVVPFWLRCGSNSPPWRRLGRVTRNVNETHRFYNPFWPHVGPILVQWSIFSMKIALICWCLRPFWLYFGCSFRADLLPKSCQNRKRWFEWAPRQHEMLIFKYVGLRNPSKNLWTSLEKSIIVWLGKRKSSNVTSKNTSKNLPKRNQNPHQGNNLKKSPARNPINAPGSRLRGCGLQSEGGPVPRPLCTTSQ